MKRFVFVLALALCFCLTAACSAEELLDQLSASAAAATAAPEETAAPAEADEETDEEPAEEASDTEEAGETAETDETAEASDTDLGEALSGGIYDSPSDTEDADTAQTADFTALSAEECVEDAWPVEGVLPRITLDCPGAESINSSIEEGFTALADDPMCEVYYEYAKGAGRVLSILMVEKVNDSLYLTAYNLDLATGEELTGPELLALLGVDEDELRNLEEAIMAEEFTAQYGEAQNQEDEEFYNQQYSRTTSVENTETQRVWFGANGQLCFAARIYGLAGAEYYEYPMGTGMFF